ncbi:non-histone chromosomal MC1 family protein [Halarchaeum sp. P4]|uniref:non-histone chromosomal MC1 family protein n=1 Tax=Halarchaeum sp. P4 TaxID=3421639 RepID=UPI003EB72B64
MVREDGKRNFALRDTDGTEDSVFSGSTPRQAALKAARRLDDVGESEDAASRYEIRLREKGTDKVHVYEAWAWQSDSPDDKPEWMPGEITQANVAKQGIEHLDER